jgi:hydrogenase-4 component E
MTLGVIILLTIFAQSDVFSPIFALIPHIAQLRMFLVGSILISIFLTINRKGALSQIIGVLSLENCIFAFGHFLGIKQATSLEIGILFDVLFWVIISNVFVKMIYRHYGSLDVTALKELKK